MNFPYFSFLHETCKRFQVDLSRVVLIGAPFLFPSFGSTLEELSHYGLDYENVFLISHPYGVDFHTLIELRSRGVTIVPPLVIPPGHFSYEAAYKEHLRVFLDETIHHIEKKKGRSAFTYVFFDAGMHMWQVLEKLSVPITPSCGIELTSSGLRGQKFRTIGLKFPVIDIGRCEAKLDLETPGLANHAVECLIRQLKQIGRFPDSCLVIGKGAVGNALAERLDTLFPVVQTNRMPKDDLLFYKLLQNELIIGCTGSPIWTAAWDRSILPKAILGSMSLGDREFDAVRFNRPDHNPLHSPIEDKNVILLNGGFPINLDGQAVAPSYRDEELRRTLMSCAILQAVSTAEKSPDIYPLRPSTHAYIYEEFSKSHDKS